MSYYSGRDARILHLHQTAFGTFAGAGQHALIKGTNSIDVDHDFNTREGGIVTGTRWAVDADVITDQKEAMPKISESADVAYKNNLADWFYGYFQQVTEEATTPFKKTFTWHATQPAFTSDAGYFETLVLQNPEASTDIAFRDCVISSLNLTVEPRGLLQANVNWSARGSGSYAYNFTGTLGRISSGSFHYSDMVRHTANVNGAGASTFNLVGPMEFEFTQDIQAVGIDASGDGRFQDYVITNKTGTFRAKMNMDSVTRGLRTAMEDDQYVDINVGWGSGTAGSADGDLDISCRVKITSYKEDLGEIYGIDVEGRIVGDNTGTTPATIILADAQDKGW